MVSRFERAKDTAQVLTESAATHMGRIAMILTGAVGEVARETGDWMTDMFEMFEASARAAGDEVRDAPARPFPTPAPDHEE
jgi:hypothetical protein